MASVTINGPACRVKEDCVRETSVLHYLDLKHDVCLYQYIKDDLKFDITSTEMCMFKEPMWVSRRHQVRIKAAGEGTEANFTCTRLEEWHLVIGGTKKILTTRLTPFSPFPDVLIGGSTVGGSGGSMNTNLIHGSSGDRLNPFDPNYVVDPTVRQILVFPQPPSMGIPWSDDIRVHGFYDYGHMPGEESTLNKLDGGNKDMYYPEWCRKLAYDPVWRAQADRRYQINWFHEPLQTEEVSYDPPGLSVSPLPRGTYVKHPLVGEIYQFLVNEAYGTHVETSPDLNSLIDAQLALATKADGSSAEFKTHDTTLYYPIGVA